MVEDESVQHAHVPAQHLVHPTLAMLIHDPQDRPMLQPFAVCYQSVSSPNSKKPEHGDDVERCEQ